MIYIGYFVILTLGFLYSFVPTFAASAGLGFRHAYAEHQAAEQGEEKAWYLLAVKPDLFNGSWQELPCVDERNSLSTTAYDGFAYLQVDRKATPPQTIAMLNRCEIFNNVTGFLLILFQLAVLVLIGLIINSLRRSIRDGKQLSRSNILYMRLIGLFVVLNSLGNALSYILSHKMIRLVAAPEVAASFSDAFPIDYGELVIGLFVLFSAEVFWIGTHLSEEQQLTI